MMPVAISFMVQHNNPKRFFSFQLFSFKKLSQLSHNEKYFKDLVEL